MSAREGDPLGYLITFTCYGTWLHGDDAGSVDRDHNVYGAPLIAANKPRKQSATRRMSQKPYQLDGPRRRLVLEALKKVCVQRGWRLLAAHVRSNHVHAVVVADGAPEPVMNDFKAYATRALNAAGLDPPKRKRWTRHGSTKYLWNEESVASAIHYTVHEQGAPMEIHLDYQSDQSRERQRAQSDERDQSALPHGRGSEAVSDRDDQHAADQSRGRQRAQSDEWDQPALPHGRGSETGLAHLTTEARNPESEAIDGLSALEIVRLMNREDARVPGAIAAQAEKIAAAIETIAERFQQGGRLIYVGAGTSGRLGVLDAAECPPTFRTPPEMVVGLIAGGPPALVRAVEGLEDHPEVGAADLAQLDVSERDVVVSIATSGRTPYCIGAADEARRRGAFAIGLVCNQPSQLDAHVDLLIAPIVGPEVISGSTRLKAGTATKLVLNMLTTGAMVRVGKTYGNLMVDLKPTNTKLWARARRIIAGLTGLSVDDAAELLTRCGGEVKTALVAGCAQLSPEQARARLAASDGHVRNALAEGMTGAAPAETDRTASDQPLLLGVDGGGSRTVALLADAAGKILGRGTAGPSNPQGVGFTAAQDAVMAAVEAAFHDAELPRRLVQAVCLGLAGAGRADDQARLREWAKNQRLGERIEIVPDALLLLAAASPPTPALPHKGGGGSSARPPSPTVPHEGGGGTGAWGLAVVAGTGSMVFGRSPDGETARAGGWGPVLGDEGSAYWIAMRALQCVVRAADGRAGPTLLAERLLAALSLDDVQQLVGHLARGAADRHRIAELAPVVDEAAEEGDAEARAILDSAARELAEQVRSVATRLQLRCDPLPLVLSGSALLRSRLLREGLLRHLESAGLQPSVETVAEPAFGAVRLAGSLARASENA